MKEKLTKLFDLKSIITILLVGTFVKLTLKNAVDVKDFMVVLMMVMAFYFNKSKEKDQ